VLLRRLVLPAQVRDHLRQVLTYELDRLTPFSPAEVFFDARVLALLGQGSKLEVELALCPRERASAWLETLRSTPTPVTTLTWAGAWPEANLLPAEARPRPRRLPWILTWLLGLLVVALLAAVLITPLWQRAHEQQRLTQALRGLSAQAQEVSEVREALERARLGSVAVLERKREYPRMTELMLELTELLPDGTWVQTLNYRDGAVDIRGESTQATALIGLLERGPGINNVTFRSPVMQIDASGNERFHIAFDYRSVEAP
jgi:general secretion pathway protein L